MNIAALHAVDASLPYDPPFRSAWQPRLEQRSRPMTFVKLVAGHGIAGWGATGGHHAAFIRQRVAPSWPARTSSPPSATPPPSARPPAPGAA